MKIYGENIMTIEGIRLKLIEFKRKSIANYRRKKINKSAFTIISNNCWGGEVHETDNLIKQSPTVGLFFMASDYIKFISNIKYYLAQSLVFIDPKQAKFFNDLKGTKNYGKYPVARLGDIEIYFMHYSSSIEAKEKWNRRVKRINWKHILYKFNDQNGCTEKDIMDFIELPLEHKICFTVNNDYAKMATYVLKIKSPAKHKFIRASYEPFGRSKYINVNNLINIL